MVDTKNPGDKTLSVSPTKTLTLKPRVEGTVRQSFSHGRTKQVVVEKRGKRRIGGDAPPTEAAPTPEPIAKTATPARPPLSRPAAPRSGSGVVLRTLTEDERSARASALAEAKIRADEERRAAEAEAARRSSREFIEQQEREAAEARRKAEEERHRLEEEAKRKAEIQAKKSLEAEAKAEAKPAATTPGRPATTTTPRAPIVPARPAAVAADASDEDEGPRQVRRGPGGAARPVVPPKTTAKPGPQKQRGRLTVVTALDADDVRERSIASFRRRTQRLKGHASNEPKEKLAREVTIPEAITIQELANRMAERAVDVIRLLMKQGAMHKITDVIDADTAQLIAEEMGHTVKRVAASDVEEGLFDVVDDSTDTEPRSPVVTVMGHVDHGKTSLLDALRHANVVSGEAGGITQHIGAYKVKITKSDSPAFGREIVFLDTPGHEAFTRMRARGAKVTDIVVVVVAADDGVMPQTLEAIDHAKAANVPIIVAVNKIDKPDANPTKVIQQLANRGLQPSNQGGDTEFVEVSAKKRLNLDLLLEMICLVADLAAPKAQPERPAVGTVIEAKLDRGRGAVASILVQNGTLHLGDSYIVGNTFGKIRAMFDDRGRSIAEAGPSTPVEILGLEGMPDAGDTFLVMADRDKAKGIAQYRKMKEREAQLAKSSRVSLEGLAEQIKQAGMKDLNLILKGDVQGSVEVLADSLQRMSTEKVRVRVLHSSVGAITESDVLLASASNAVIIGFNVRPDRKAAEIAERENVEIRLHSIIYELQDEITKAMYGLLEPVYKENYAGRAEVLQVFKITKVGQIAGCRVTDGLIKRDAQVRVLRDGEEVWKGKIASLKRVKDDVSEVRQGVECGIDLAGFKDIKAGDIIESFTTETLAAELGQNSAAARKAEKAAKEKAAAEAAAAATAADSVNA